MIRWLHRGCAPRKDLTKVAAEREAMWESADYWENQYRVRDADATAAATRHKAAVDKLVDDRNDWRTTAISRGEERDAARRTVDESVETIDRIGGEVVLLAEELTQAKAERDDARYWLAAANSQLVDLRGAGVLTRDDIVQAIKEWAGNAEWHFTHEARGNLAEALLAAQRKPTAEALQSAVEAVTEGVTQEVGE